MPTAGTDPVATTAARCPTYGVLVCERDHKTMQTTFHCATLWNGDRVNWGPGCDETCTADCGWCKGALRRAREAKNDR